MNFLAHPTTPPPKKRENFRFETGELYDMWILSQ